MGITLTTPTQHPQCMSPFGSFHLFRSSLTTVLRNQEWPEHFSREEHHLKSGATPNDLMRHEANAGVYSPV
jgi:hypothetical protein